MKNKVGILILLVGVVLMGGCVEEKNDPIIGDEFITNVTITLDGEVVDSFIWNPPLISCLPSEEVPVPDICHQISEKEHEMCYHFKDIELPQCFNGYYDECFRFKTPPPDNTTEVGWISIKMTKVGKCPDGGVETITWVNKDGTNITVEVCNSPYRGYNNMFSVTTTTMITETTTTIIPPIDAYEKFVECGWYCFEDDRKHMAWGNFIAIHNVIPTHEALDCRESCGDAMTDCYRVCMYDCSEEHAKLCGETYKRCKERCANSEGSYNLKGLNFTYYPKERKEYSEMVEECKLSEDNYVEGYVIGEASTKHSFDYWRSLERHAMDTHINFTTFEGLIPRSVCNVWVIDDDEYIEVSMEDREHSVDTVIEFSRKIHDDGLKYRKIHVRGCFL